MVVKSRHIILQGDEAAASLWLPFAFNKLEEMRRERKKVNTNLRRLFNKVRKFEPATDITIMVKLYNDQGQIIINAKSTGEGIFLTRPTSDECTDGWGEPFYDDDGEPITGDPPFGTCAGAYPRAIFYANYGFKKSDKFEFDYGTQDVVAGNLDWLSTDKENKLTWRGRNGRHVGFYEDAITTRTSQSPVLLSGQEYINDDVPANKKFETRDGDGSYETIGSIVYRDGYELVDIGAPIFGASLRTDSDGVTHLQVVFGSVNVNYGADYVELWSAPIDDQGDIGSITYSTLFNFYTDDEWVDNGSPSTTYHLYNTGVWAFNGSGTEVQCAAVRYYDTATNTVSYRHLRATIDDSGNTTPVTVSIHTPVEYYAQSCSRSFSGAFGDGEYHTWTYNFSWSRSENVVIAADYIGDDDVSITLSSSITGSQNGFLEVQDLVGPGTEQGGTTDHLDAASEILKFSLNGVVVGTHTLSERQDSVSLDTPLGSGTSASGGGTFSSTGSRITFMDARYFTAHVDSLRTDEVYTYSGGTDVDSADLSQVNTYTSKVLVRDKEVVLLSEVTTGQTTALGFSTATADGSECAANANADFDRGVVTSSDINQIQYARGKKGVVSMPTLMPLYKSIPITTIGSGGFNGYGWGVNQDGKGLLDPIDNWETRRDVYAKLVAYSPNMVALGKSRDLDLISKIPGTTPRYGPTGVL